MELFQAKDEYILQSGDRALWCSRKDGSMTVRPGTYRMTSFSATAAAAAAAGHLSEIKHLVLSAVGLEWYLFIYRHWVVLTLCVFFFFVTHSTALPQKVSPVLSIASGKLSFMYAHKRDHTNEVAYSLWSPRKSLRSLNSRNCLLLSGMPTPLWHSKCLPLRLGLRFPRT